ncbi:DUF3613 domain-containing protein [Pokkaliibacter sp. MBI-7]|uniref:DUF3613 domain-containing protein n=1 Tax=Pokkaliibacter sp. MBI-7 TaxID=3040600 RepID=UPI002447ACF3|nr:DUF3613 domain-containing protein [Pokkaliibacter sp. MBI-7]MDH2433038.1 DUF3613 domain-containing protein [Pokkaliibacter sp. MBI-7]
MLSQCRVPALFRAAGGWLIGVVGCVVCAPVLAANPAPAAATVTLSEPDTRTDSVPSSGSETRQWLQMQRDGRYASHYNDQLTPEAAAKAQQRVTDSFGQSIPATYIDKDFGK